MKLNLTLISILLFIIIILILFILNNNLERFIVLNTDNNKITDTIDLPVPELNQVCTSTDCTDILWHKDCNSASYYFDSECEERRTYIFNQGKTVLGKDCHLTNLQTGCCPGQGGNNCNCDSLGKTISNVGCGCGISKINGCCPGINKDCSGTCGGNKRLNDCNQCKENGESTKQINGCCPEETDVGCGCDANGKTINKGSNGCCPGITKDCDNTCGGTKLANDCGECVEGGISSRTNGCCPGISCGHGCQQDGRTCNSPPTPVATQNVGQNCTNNNQCYSGICTYKPPVGWLSEKTTCDGKAYGQPCTNARQHCQNGHKCENGTCGPIKRNWNCDGPGDSRCEPGTSCQWYRYDAEWVCR